MRVCVTERRDPSPGDLRPAGELAPNVALPWVVKLRYGLIGGIAALILLSDLALGVELPLGWLALPWAAMAASNFLLPRVLAAWGGRAALGASMAFDTLCLTALLALTGGPANPFTLLYVVQIALSAVVLSKGWTWALGGLSVACFGALFPAHVALPALEAHHSTGAFSAHLVGMWMAFAGCALLITVFIGKVSEALRRREQEMLALQEQLARHERLGSLATLAAGAAHELGTPLGTIAVVARDLELYAAENPEIADDARLIRAEVERCRRILQQMSERGAEPWGEAPSLVALAEMLEDVKREFAENERDAIRIQVSGARMQAELPAAAAKQALTALVRNALDASGPGQQVLVSAESGGGNLRFHVRDSGSGMTRDALNRVAEPFFTTKTPGRGMGLGTFLVRAFAHRLNGSLTFESEPGKGTLAILDLPITAEYGKREAAGAGS